MYSATGRPVLLRFDDFGARVTDEQIVIAAEVSSAV